MIYSLKLTIGIYLIDCNEFLKFTICFTFIFNFELFIL